MVTPGNKVRRDTIGRRTLDSFMARISQRRSIDGLRSRRRRSSEKLEGRQCGLERTWTRKASLEGHVLRLEEEAARTGFTSS
jgi:hypothetical protein